MGNNESIIPEDHTSAGFIRGALQIVGGVLPGAGGVLSAIAGAWSENEQKRINRFFEQWVQMLEDELKEKEKTVIDIMSRLDMHDEKIAERVESKEFQSLMRKTFRDWAAVESEEKRVYIRNVLTNAASSNLTSDDVIRLFIDLISKLSELHLKVVSCIYNNNGITRAEVWEKLGKGDVREDSAEADLFKLLFRELSTCGLVRQHREKDSNGNFYAKDKNRVKVKHYGHQYLKSAFDNEEEYELTALGGQFVHYAMTDLPIKIEFNPEE